MKENFQARKKQIINMDKMNRKKQQSTQSSTVAQSSRAAIIPGTDANITPGIFPGIKLDAGTARNAVILSEIIGKPVSKRGRRR